MIIHTPIEYDEYSCMPTEIRESAERLFDIIEKDFNEKVETDQYMFSKANGAIYITGNIEYPISDIIPDIDMLNVEYYIYICFDRQDYFNLLNLRTTYNQEFDYNKNYMRLIGFQVEDELLSSFKSNVSVEIHKLKRYYNELTDKHNWYKRFFKLYNSIIKTDRVVSELVSYKELEKQKNIAQDFYSYLIEKDTNDEFKATLDGFSEFQEFGKLYEYIKENDVSLYSYQYELGDRFTDLGHLIFFKNKVSLRKKLRNAYEKYIITYKPDLVSERIKQLNDFENSKVWYGELTYGLESFYDEYQQEK